MQPKLSRALALLHSGEKSEVEEAVRLLQGTVYAFSMKVCGHREDAEDTMQDVLMRSLPHLTKIEDARALAVWLYTAARNRCWRSRRKPAQAPSEMLSLDELMPEEGELQRLLRSADRGPEEHTLQGEQHQILHQAVLTLPASYRLVLVLHDMEDLETEQVAKILDLRPATVRVRLHRARLAVRKAMSVLLETGELPVRPEMSQPGNKQRRTAKRRPSQSEAECRALFGELSEYLDGRMPPQSCDAMKKHIEACPACIAFLRDLTVAIGRCRSFRPECEAEIPARLTELLTQEYLRMVGQPV